MSCVRPPLVALLLALVAAEVPAFARADAVTSPPSARPATEEQRRALDAARAELASLAARIETLKQEVAAGRAGRTQLQPLLARAQELAAAIERLEPPHPVPTTAPTGPDPQELRERADALRDRADRLDRTLSQVETRLVELRRRARLEQGLQNVGGAGDVLADGAPRAASTRTASAGAARTTDAAPTSGPVGTGGAAGQPGTATPPTTTTPPPTGGATSPATAASTPSASADAAARALSVPPPREADPLLPGAGDSIQDLLRKRARMQGEASTLRAQADALDAEAVRTENVR